MEATIGEQSFDAWGRVRNYNDWSKDTITQATTSPFASLSNSGWLNRGYTGHEHLSQFNIINMNGRLYDPIVGRMLSADNYNQDATSSQTYNRYSYVLNNPLKYTDPSGWKFVHPQQQLRRIEGWELDRGGGTGGSGMNSLMLSDPSTWGAFTPSSSFGMMSLMYGNSAAMSMTGSSIYTDIQTAMGNATNAVMDADYRRKQLQQAANSFVASAPDGNTALEYSKHRGGWGYWSEEGGGWTNDNTGSGEGFNGSQLCVVNKWNAVNLDFSSPSTSSYNTFDPNVRDGLNSGGLITGMIGFSAAYTKYSSATETAAAEISTAGKIGRLGEKAGALGVGLTIGLGLYELKHGQADSHTILNTGIAVSLFVLGAIVSAPVAAVIGGVGLTYGISSIIFDTDKKFDNITNHWGQHFFYHK